MLRIEKELWSTDALAIYKKRSGHCFINATFLFPRSLRKIHTKKGEKNLDGQQVCRNRKVAQINSQTLMQLIEGKQD